MYSCCTMQRVNMGCQLVRLSHAFITLTSFSFQVAAANFEMKREQKFMQALD